MQANEPAACPSGFPSLKLMLLRDIESSCSELRGSTLHKAGTGSHVLDPSEGMVTCCDLPVSCQKNVLGYCDKLAPPAASGTLFSQSSILGVQ